MPENAPAHPPVEDAVPEDAVPADDTELDNGSELDDVDEREAAPPVVLIAAAAVGLVTAFSVPLDEPGVGWLVGGIAATAGVIAIRRPTHWSQIAWGALALGLISVGTYRAATWLFVLCAVGACVAGSLAVFGGRTVGQVVFATIVIPVRAVRDIPWLARGFTTSSRERDGERTFRMTASIIVGVLLVLVFGALFAGADPTFAHLVSAAVPSVDNDTVARWIFLFLAAAGGTAAAGHLLLAPPHTADRKGGPALRTVEWAVPVGLLVLLFAVFVADQVAALFGGADYVLRTAHLTYARYARTGFWQLLLVTGLTLVVIAVVVAKAGRV
ncbi:MAG TPA: DUF4153 domain-containing protein, partial [Pseudonocardiaceae bacterium]|nr:DUF4153 domain-containing protein [Pseudonocardiaceae bacterium]